MLRILIHTAASPAADLALEEAIHLDVENGTSPDTWRFWQPEQQAVILGTGQEAAREANLDLARQAGVPVLRRHSGGGAVVIGPGCINFSAFYRIAGLKGSETIRGAMSAALAPVLNLFQHWKINACEAGLSDLAVAAPDGTLRKIAGNSQARKRVSVVVHGTVLADPDWDAISALLHHPSSTPDYRAGRPHRAFLTSLRENGAPHELQSFMEGLCALLPSDRLVDAEPSVSEHAAALVLLKDKYGVAEWNFRR